MPVCALPTQNFMNKQTIRGTVFAMLKTRPRQTNTHRQFHGRNINKGAMGERETRGWDDDKVSWFDEGRLKLRRSYCGEEGEKMGEECGKQSDAGGRACEGKRPQRPVCRPKSTEHPHVSVSWNYTTKKDWTKLIADQLDEVSTHWGFSHDLLCILSYYFQACLYNFQKVFPLQWLGNLKDQIVYQTPLLFPE